MRLSNLFLVISLMMSAPMALAQTAQEQSKLLSIKSSVSAEFTTGLHYKYLQFIADKMQAKLELHPMPFARRLKTLNACQIDLMVGVKKSYDHIHNIVFLEPAYETLRNEYYVLKNRYDAIQTIEDVRGLTLGVTLDNTQILTDLRERGVSIIPVSTLKSKIKLLLKKRVDVFTHFADSADVAIKKQGLEHEIIRAKFQSANVRQYYFVTCKQSVLMPYKSKLESIIRQAYDNGDFRKIRTDHYAIPQTEK